MQPEHVLHGFKQVVPVLRLGFICHQTKLFRKLMRVVKTACLIQAFAHCHPHSFFSMFTA